MGFVQIIEFRTSRLAEVQEVGNEWEKATEGKRKAGRSILCEDRDNPAGICRSCSSSRMKRQWRTRLCPRPMRSPGR